MTFDDVMHVLSHPGETPLAVIAGVVLSVAAFIGRRVSASMQRQGARLGAVETDLESEITRRRQLEQCLREQGIRLPFWPKDPVALYLAGGGRRDDFDDEPSAYPPPSVPPFPPTETARYAQHARHSPLFGDPE